MTDKNGKVWGETSCIFFQSNVEIHRLTTNKDAYCSKHKHEHKYNKFFVESGVITITVWKNDYDLVDVTLLGPGESMVVRPGEYHQFRCREAAVVYEIYWTELEQSDITRESCGGTPHTPAGVDMKVVAEFKENLEKEGLMPK